MTRIVAIVVLLLSTVLTGSLTACKSIEPATESHHGYGGEGGHGGVGGVGGNGSAGAGGGGHGGGGH